MNKLYLGLFFLCFIGLNQIMNGQNILFESQLDYDGAEKGVKEIQICQESLNGDLGVFLYSDKENFAILLDSNFAEKKVLLTPKPRLFFTTNIGQIYKDGKYQSFYTDGPNYKISAHIFDFENEVVDFKTKNLPFVKGEKVLATFPSNGFIYFVTIKEGTSKLMLYEFDSVEHYIKTEFLFEDDKFSHFLGDNLYNCISHDLLRPVNEKYLYDYVFSDKEDYLIYDDSNIYIISNTNTVISIELNSKKAEIKEFSKLSKDKKVPEFFKNFSKDHRTRSFIQDSKYFRVYENNEEIGIEVYDIFTQNLMLDSILFKSEFLQFPLASDRVFKKKITKEDSFKSLLKGKMALRVFQENDQYVLNIGRDFDRLFELDNGYFELRLGYRNNALEILLPEFVEGKFDEFRLEGQNLNYEFDEIIFRESDNTLKFIQYNKKDRVLKIMD